MRERQLASLISLFSRRIGVLSTPSLRLHYTILYCDCITTIYQSVNYSYQLHMGYNNVYFLGVARVANQGGGIVMALMDYNKAKTDINGEIDR
jgi:hypothetical protein